jgi:hypothetical protein
VGRRIHTGVVTSPAIVAEIRKIEDVAFSKIPARLDGAKHRAQALAIAASVADNELAVSLREEINLGHSSPPFFR